MKFRKCLFFLGLLTALSHLAYAQLPIIEYAEYYFDVDPGPGNGTDIPLPEPLGPTIDTSVVIPDTTIAALNDGFHLLVVRTRDDQGNYSIGFSRTFKKGAETERASTPDIVAAEYFFNTDPGQGNGKKIPLTGTPGETASLIVHIPVDEINALEIGFHRLTCRVQDSEGDWSVAFSNTFRRVVPPTEEEENPGVARIEYQWMVDGEDVGDPVSLEPDLEPDELAPKILEFMPPVDLTKANLDGVTAVLRVAPFDADGDMGWPGFKQVIIVWLDEENGGVGDGFPDQWEELDPTVINDKDKDSDKDNLSDYDEFLAGKDPGNPDTDGDGIWDGSELFLVDYGCDPDQDNSDLLTNLQAAAFGAGFYSTEFQLKDLNLLGPVVGRDPDTGEIFLRLRIQKSSKLQDADWAQLALGSDDVSTTGGDIKITIPDLEDDIYFLRIFTDQDFE